VAAGVADELLVADAELETADAATADDLPRRKLDLVEVHLVTTRTHRPCGDATDVVGARLCGHERSDAAGARSVVERA
jgi:hypothetical protein